MNFKVVNVVATFNTECNINLSTIAKHLWNIEYNPSKFNAAICRSRKYGCTFLIFKNGKIVCCGTKSLVDSFWACKKFCIKLFRKCNLRTRFKDWKAQNVVATFSLNRRLKLLEIKERIEQHCFNFGKLDGVHYEPELFSALQIKLPRRSILIFITSRVILTGFVNPTELNKMYELLKNQL